MAELEVMEHPPHLTAVEDFDAADVFERNEGTGGVKTAEAGYSVIIRCKLQAKRGGGRSSNHLKGEARRCGHPVQPSGRGKGRTDI